MRPNQPLHPPPPPPTSSSSLPSGAGSTTPAGAVARKPTRRRVDLTLPLPRRDPSLAVPLPLPPPSAPATLPQQQQQHHPINSNNNNNSQNNSRIAAAANNNNNHAGDSSHPAIHFSELERVSRVGSGAGGTVYKVVHKPTGRHYALKVIYGEYHEEAVRRQICREISILRDVDNPNVVKCHDMFDHNGEIQVLLEFMDRGSLEGQRITSERELADLARQTLRGLAYLHSRRIVHRDIKPSNLLINAKKQVKIADFGVSRILEQTMDPCNSSVGTIAYMSPERINTDLNQGQYDGYAGDIWSLGVSMLEFYMGRFPFAVARGGDWASLMVSICMSQPPQAPPTASREFRDFISRCLQRVPAERWTATRLLNHPFVMTQAAAPAGGTSQGINNVHQLLPPPPRQPPS